MALFSPNTKGKEVSSELGTSALDLCSSQGQINITPPSKNVIGTAVCGQLRHTEQLSPAPTKRTFTGVEEKASHHAEHPLVDGSHRCAFTGHS